MKIEAPILVIEDEEDIRQMICDILNEDGYSTIQAADGHEGLLSLRKTPEIHIVITDLLMPKKEGIATISELRKDFPWIKIIAISGGGICFPENYLNRAKAMGADATLCKPFGNSELLSIIDELNQ
ncbi:response regulator receiver protein [Chlorobaculum parvum NCIB 8327]|uniref:Response regulator receiver protein n=1 Tax=Chlorobaculum parvum (strain DSM 263 / NCIMB 8327) TaxID=517417 RepID=B3QL87_CHLP8|nr:response regulator [Chlorobaculum parvum]ACF12325.1 response regulator receiver protein [Chlorobaculum parvum NCIB 8327]